MINEACNLSRKGLNQLKLIMSSEFRPRCIIHIPDPAEKGDRCILRISDQNKIAWRIILANLFRMFE